MLRHCPKCSYPNPGSRETCFGCGCSLKPEPGISVFKDGTSESIRIEKDKAKNKCFHCGVELYIPDCDVKLCPRCRNKLVHYPIPLWLISSFALLIILMLLSIPLWVNSVNVGVDYERGLIAEQNNDYKTAAKYYNELYNKYPDSPVLLARIVIVQYKSGNKKAALSNVQQLQGRALPISTGNELAETIPEISVQKK